MGHTCIPNKILHPGFSPLLTAYLVSTPKLQQGNCWEISVTLRLFLKKPSLLVWHPLMGSIMVRIIIKKSNNNNVAIVGLILNSKRQTSTVVKNAVSRGRTLDFKS